MRHIIFNTVFVCSWLAVFWLAATLGGCGTGTQVDCQVFNDAPYCDANQ